MVYGVISDLHCHDWSAFSSVNADGVNSRLAMILSEIDEVCNEVKAQGGDTVVIAGDIFHTRGSIDPEVLNPTRKTFLSWMAKGINFLAIPGNHDLKSDETSELSSAITNLGLGARFRIFNQPTLYTTGGVRYAFVPWCKNREALLKAIEASCPAATRGDVDLFIHAGIDGVLSGMPDHGLTAKELAAFGFKRVFAGHYHNHKVMEGGKVISIGATTQQTWSDVGSRAGFLVVSDTDVKFRAARTPSFIDITGMDADEVVLTVPGNYVRLRGDAMTATDIAALRKILETNGARGISLQVAVTSAVAASTPSTARGLTIEESIEGYVLSAKFAPGVNAADVLSEALDIMVEARTIHEDA